LGACNDSSCQSCSRCVSRSLSSWLSRSRWLWIPSAAGSDGSPCLDLYHTRQVTVGSCPQPARRRRPYAHLLEPGRSRPRGSLCWGGSSTCRPVDSPGLVAEPAGSKAGAIPALPALRPAKPPVERRTVSPPGLRAILYRAGFRRPRAGLSERAGTRRLRYRQTDCSYSLSNATRL
jgi:hypothetical protein